MGVSGSKKKVSGKSRDDRLPDIGEFGLIRRIAGRGRQKDPSVLLGIGDDAAVIDWNSYQGGSILLTTDALLEDVHFRRDHPPRLLGWKALAVNISDIAAMGGVPRCCLLSLSVPDNLSLSYLDELIAGIREACRTYSVSIVGGDTTSSPDKIYISMTLLGEGKERVLTRSGAGPGDLVYVSGTLGDSSLGFRILETGTIGSFQGRAKGYANRLIRNHLKPVPRVEDGKLLARSKMVTSMIDVSDGLLADLGHICDESGVGATVRMEKLPLSTAFRRIAADYGGISLALSGGEDYQLLFTVRRGEAHKFKEKTADRDYTCIGEITRGGGVRVICDKGEYVPEKKGFEHFRDS